MYKSTQGLNLIELLVVIAISGILLSIAIPQMQQYIIKARVTHAMSNLNGYKLQLSSDLILANATPPQTFPVDNKFIESLQLKAQGSSQHLEMLLQLKNSHTNGIGLAAINNQPFKISLIAHNSAHNLTWSCYSNPEYHSYVPDECKFTEENLANNP